MKKNNTSTHKLLAIDDHSCIQYYTQLHNLNNTKKSALNTQYEKTKAKKTTVTKKQNNNTDKIKKKNTNKKSKQNTTKKNEQHIQKVTLPNEDTIPSDLEVRPLFLREKEQEELLHLSLKDDFKNVSFFYCYKNDSLTGLELNFHKFNMFNEVTKVVNHEMTNRCKYIYSCLSEYMYVKQQDNVLWIDINDLNTFFRMLDKPIDNRINIKFLNNKGILESTIFFKYQNSKLYTYIKPAFDNLASIIINQCDNVNPYIEEIEQLRRQIHLNLNTNILMNYIIQYFYSLNSREKTYPEKRRKDF